MVCKLIRTWSVISGQEQEGSTMGGMTAKDSNDQYKPRATEPVASFLKTFPLKAA